MRRSPYAKAHRHPEFRDRTIWQVFEAERGSLVPPGRFDGFHAVPGSVSKTCLVRFDNNRYRAVIDRGRVQPGQWLAVHGCGGVGLSAVQIAAAADAMVVAVDIDDRKLAKARDEGAAATISARGLTPEQVAEFVKDATGGGAHVSIEALGRAFTFHQSIQSLRKRGRHVQAGITSQEESGQVAVPVDFTFTYATWAAKSRRAELVLMPLLDILQEGAHRAGATADFAEAALDRVGNRHDARGDPGSAKICDLRVWCDHPGCGALGA
jgi:threonine dehydrogenase-like Zn-dependent dehydrogenase